MDKKSFRQYGYKFVDWVAEYLEGIEKYPVRSQVNPGEIIEQIPEFPPQEGESMEAIFEDFKNVIRHLGKHASGGFTSGS